MPIKSNKLSPLDSYRYVIRHRCEPMANLVAGNSFQPDYRPTFGTAILFLVMITFVGCCLYTMCTYDSDSVIQCSTVTGIVLQAPAKFRSAIFESTRWYKNHQNVMSMYSAIDATDSPRLKAKAEQFARFYRRATPVLMALVWLAALAMIVNPVVIYVLLGVEYSPVIPSYIPFVNEKQMRGYLINTCYHIVCVIMAACGNIVADWYFASIIMHVYLSVSLVDDAKDTLNRYMDENRCERVVRRQHCKLYQLHQDFCAYTKELNSYYYVISTTDLYMNGFSLCTLMYTTLKLNWSPGYFLTVMMLFKLFMLCALGTCIQIANDHVYQVVLNISWYQLPTIGAKKEYKLMVFQAQYPTYLQAGVERLDMETFVHVIKKVNSVAMLLLQLNE